MNIKEFEKARDEAKREFEMRTKPKTRCLIKVTGMPCCRCGQYEKCVHWEREGGGE